MSGAPAEPGLLSSLRSLLRGRVVVMGIGNPTRGDDAVGSVIARRLRAALQTTSFAPDTASTTVLDAEEIPESWLGPAVAASPQVVLLVDAVELDAPAGAAALLRAEELAGRVLFTHRTPLRPLVRYLETETGATVALLAVQPGARRWGEELSPAVASAAADLVVLLTELLARPRPAARVPEAIAC